ncbi:hypothetical protein BRDID11004_75180 [Bradyrhizobium diazoefficiens]|uniref:Uncharacterized protein n=1 Tax=Bradyrhizobium diazoefficiens TaxID=1355477 RepID=A0A810AEX8_9BRAD|nr:hypothetical protein F07S3_11860 [Bradyrhizobium diazoefficiens]BCA09339.1 hypothetical protein BDHF08_11860 [Bradyrhizobium diazoefficiens]BCE53677.1 hypothetical protein XF5B_11890 [Bradyrhizobium diazoefficiens]BCE62397.1 hypothetical protein XF6B_11960 [Bradyrhizobium diazoefficiens]
MPPTGHKVSSESLEDFRRIYEEASGEEIATEEATEMAHGLLALFRLISRPLPGGNEKPPLSPPSPALSAAEEL